MQSLDRCTKTDERKVVVELSTGKILLAHDVGFITPSGFHVEVLSTQSVWQTASLIHLYKYISRFSGFGPTIYYFNSSLLFLSSLLIVLPIWSTTKLVSFPCVSPPASPTQITPDQPHSQQSVSTSLVHSSTAGNVSSAFDWLQDLVAQTNISSSRRKLLCVSPYSLLHFSPTSHAGRDFSINSRR